MDSEILELKQLEHGCPVMMAFIPKPILEEIDVWIKESRSFKNHPLSELRSHENVAYCDETGNNHNSYQCSISPRLIEESFWLSWVLRLTAKYWGTGRNHRNFRLRKWDGHFDGYDIWTNFSYIGDDNPIHSHSGFLSGIIYYKNDGHPTIFPDYDLEYEGTNGTMLIFPSQVQHYVRPKTTKEERITLAFNINKNE
jgi:hypothetical protein